MNAIASFPTLHPSSTDIEFCTWLGQAAPGDRLEYHRGLLVVDAAEVVSLLPKTDRVRLSAFFRLSVGRLFSITRIGMPFTKATMSQRLVWLDAVLSTENSAVTWKTLFPGRSQSM